jgi:hypothetical protein
MIGVDGPRGASGCKTGNGLKSVLRTGGAGMDGSPARGGMILVAAGLFSAGAAGDADGLDGAAGVILRGDDVAGETDGAAGGVVPDCGDEAPGTKPAGACGLGGPPADAAGGTAEPMRTGDGVGAAATGGLTGSDCAGAACFGGSLGGTALAAGLCC